MLILSSSSARAAPLEELSLVSASLDCFSISSSAFASSFPAQRACRAPMCIVDRKLLKLTLIVKRGEAEEVGVHDGRRRGAEARFPRRNGVFLRAKFEKKPANFAYFCLFLP